MITVKEAQKLINDNIIPLQALSLPLNQISGCVLAEDLYAEFDIPAFRQSSMDGYALRFTENLKELILAGEMAAGANQSFNLEEGETSRIFTGAPLPEGSDTVVMQEKIEKVGNKILIKDQQLAKGTNVREKGSEVKAGALAITKGTLLGPAAIGFLAGIGVTQAAVFPTAKVAIILTGNELQSPGAPLEFGQVYESNSYSLSAAIKNEGITEITVFRALDDLQSLTSVLATAIAGNDVVLLTGGVSVGDYDFVIEACRNCEVKQVFHKVKQKPGKPLFFGTQGEKIIFGLPGNPSSVLSCYYNYVLPALKKLSGKSTSVRHLTAELTANYNKPSGLTHFLKGSYHNGKVTPLHAQESYRMASFAQSNCLITLKEDQQIFAAGDTVEILLLPH